MRERDYRVWDKLEKAMLSTPEAWARAWKGKDTDPENGYDYHARALYISQEGHIIEHTDEHGICDTHWMLQGESRYILLDFIGRKDSDDVKIHEGDILATCSEERIDYYEEVEWDEEMLCWALNDGSKELRPLSDFFDPSCRVVGNIYQNTELRVA